MIDKDEERRLWLPLFVGALLVGLVLRFYLASFARTPGHGDSAFYYTVAKNIVNGRGPVIDYIVYFLDGLLPIPSYAGVFWNPSAAFLIAVPMALFGKTIGYALIASITAGVVPAVAAYLAGKEVSQSAAVGALAGVLTFFSPFQVWFSVTTEAIIFGGAFGAVSLYLMMRGARSPRSFLLAAVFTGLANLMRQDNILLLAALEGCILLASLAWRQRILLGVAALAIHVLVLSPLLAENVVQLHTIFPAGPGKTAFLTTYEDFHSYGKELDWHSLRATWGLQGILKRKLHTAWENLGQVDYFLTPIFTWLCLAGLVEILLLRGGVRGFRLLLPPILFALLEYAFYTIVASFSGPGSLIKSLGALMPFICIVIVSLLARYLKPRLLLIAAVLVLAAYGGYLGFQKNLTSTLYYNGVYEQYKTVKATILQDAAARGLRADQIRIMARDTWDVNEGTGLQTIMVPNNDIDTILFVAQHYDAHYLLLPGKRPQLDKIYTGVGPDPRFHFVGRIPNSDMEVFFMDF